MGISIGHKTSVQINLSDVGLQPVAFVGGPEWASSDTSVAVVAPVSNHAVLVTSLDKDGTAIITAKGKTTASDPPALVGCGYLVTVSKNPVVTLLMTAGTPTVKA
jgi:hypothetical protein